MQKNLFETALHFDQNQDLSQLIECITSSSYSMKEISSVVAQLLNNRKMRSAFVMAKLLADHNYHDPIVSIALCIGGFVYCIKEEEVRGLEMLQAQVDTMSAVQRKAFDDYIIVPVILRYLLIWPSLDSWKNDHVLQILEILKAADPRFRKMFDWNATVPRVSIDRLRSQGRNKARLINAHLPHSWVASQPKHVIVALPKWNNSVSHESVSERFLGAFNAYGWTATFCDTDSEDSWDNKYRVIVEACRQSNADILLLAIEQIVNNKHDIQIRNSLYEALKEMISQLKRENRQIKILGFLGDAWWHGAFYLTEPVMNLYDMIIDVSGPSLPLWSKSWCKNKVIHIPVPSGCDNGALDYHPLMTTMLFNGSIGVNTPHRAFWIAATDRLGLQVNKIVSTYEHCPALESYEKYKQRIVEATCVLNLVMRYNQDSIVNGRVFETILNGALLVQEFTPDIHYFFIPGEHYFEFSSVAELVSITNFIKENREEAEEVRRCGSAFAREHYNDKKLIGYLDKALYYSEPH